MNPGNLPVSWFDIVVVVALGAGIILGRRKGLSEELLPVFQWLAVVVIGGLYYQPVGRFLAGYAQITLLTGYVITYIGIIVFHALLFSWLKHLVGEKLVSSDIFGSLEYSLGMVAGGLKAACLLVVLLALVNSRYVSQEELAADAQMQQENFGTISFPTFGRVQQVMLSESISGQMVGKYMKDQLIASTPPGQRLVHRESISRKQEKAVDEILNNQ